MTDNSGAVNYYTEFGIAPAADTTTIGRTLDEEHRKWSRRTTGADRGKARAAEDRVELISEARAVLTDQARRAAYDRRLAERNRPAPPRPAGAKAKRAPQPAQRTTRRPQPTPQPSVPPKTEDWLASAFRKKKAGDIPGAVYDARLAVHHNPRLAQAWRLLGDLHLRTGETAAAVEEYERAVKLEPRHADTHRWLAEAYNRQGRVQDALHSLWRAIELAPAERAYPVLAANLLYAAGQLDDSLQLYETALVHEPTNEGLRNRIAEGWTKKAEQFARRTLNGGLIITSAQAAQTIGGIAARGIAAEPTDAALRTRLFSDQAAAQHALTIGWRPRPMRMFGGVLGALAFAALFSSVSDMLANLLFWCGAPAVLFFLGRQPHWGHTARRESAGKPGASTPRKTMATAGIIAAIAAAIAGMIN